MGNRVWDVLDLALSRGADRVVPGNSTLAWQVTLHVGHGRAALEAIVARNLDYAFAGQG